MLATMFAQLKSMRASAALLFLLGANSARSELLLYYDFNDASDPATVADRSGKGNHAEVFDAEYTADGGGRSGNVGDRALDFMEDQDFVYIEVPTAEDGAFESIVEKDSATIALWAYGGEFQPQNNFIFWFAEGDEEPRQLSAHVPWSNGQIYFDAAGCCEGNTRISAPLDPSVFSETWSHYVFVKDGETTSIYVNGEFFLDSGENVIDPLGDIHTVRFGSGQAPGQWSYNGFLDDVCVWDEAISEEKIEALAAGATCDDGAALPGDFNGNGQLDDADIDLLSAEVRAGTNQAQFDLNQDAQVNDIDRQLWVADPMYKKTWFGDANLTGEFNSGDLVQVLASGTYEANVDSGWSSGDFNGDQRTDSSDLVVALADGGYELGPRPAVAAVPEPAGWALALIGLLGLRGCRRAATH
jgi:hypothetical protein